MIYDEYRRIHVLALAPAKVPVLLLSIRGFVRNRGMSMQPQYKSAASLLRNGRSKGGIDQLDFLRIL